MVIGSPFLLMTDLYVVPQRSSRILANTLRIYFTHFGVIVPIFAVTLFPFWIIWDFVASSVASILVLQLVNFAIITVATGVLTAAIHDICVGNRPTIAHSFSFANERFGNLLGVSLLETLIISLGLVLLIVPGIILWAFYLFFGIRGHC